MKVWIDIDNAPQVQYLLPFRAPFQSAGSEVVITARDYGETLDLLNQSGVRAEVFGARVGRNKLRKLLAVLVRARELVRFFDERGRPDLLLAASRSSAVAARRLGIPSFILGDYEHVHRRIYRFTDSTIVHPDVIDPEQMRRHGIRRTLPFRGIKEDLTFAEIDVDSVEPHDLGELPVDAVRVLFRPPSETSHYYKKASTAMALATLRYLARQGALVVFSPRERTQVAYLQDLAWRHAPVVIERPVPFVSLLKSVDAVVCAGGTMLREAAYLGIPAYSIFRNEVGAVDRWLERCGRVVLLSGPEELPRLKLARRGPLARLDSNPQLREELVSSITQMIDGRRI
jgi:predicted glycosyltransferase